MRLSLLSTGAGFTSGPALRRGDVLTTDIRALLIVYVVLLAICALAASDVWDG